MRPAVRRATWLAGTTGLLAMFAAVIFLGGRGPATADPDPFHPSDAALVARTGQPQLLEFFSFT